jgi:cytochrome c556
VVATPVWAQEPPPIVKQRQDLMKQQGKDLTAIKAFLDGKGDQAAAQAAADDLLRTLPQVPNAFPQKTSSADFPGKTRAKPDIWAEWDKFVAAQQNALSKAQALDAAIKSGDKAAITAAFDSLGRDVGGRTQEPGACGTCHAAFRVPAT